MEQTHETQHSVKTMVSYGFGKFAAEFFTLAFTTYCFFFYETELGLATGWTAAGYIIYAIWNSINDPIVGYLTNRGNPWMKKWGKRYPFIVLAAIPWVFIYILIFAPPNVDPQTEGWVLFLWLTIFSCLFDTLYSIWDVNYQAIFPDKFRGDKERRKAAGIGTIVGVFGIALGSILPPLFVDDGVRSSYLTQGIIIACIGFAAVICMLPGTKETPEMIQRSITQYEQNAKEPKTFFTQFKEAVRNRNVLAFLLLYFLYQSLAQSMTGSIPYYVKFILGRPQSSVTIVMTGFLVGALVSIPLWIKLAHKLNNNQQLILIGSFLLAGLTSPLIFVENYYAVIILMIFWGMGLGLFWAMTGPVFADAIDDVVVTQGKREEGVYMGFRALFGRLAFAVQALNFLIVHELTGFIEGSDTQSSFALQGIHIHMALIPVILMLLGGFLFWKLNTLNPERCAKIKQQLKELKL